MRIILFLLMFICSFHSKGQKKYKQSLLLMGSNFDISVIANTSQEGEKYIKMAIDEISRIEELISSWDSKSQTSLINRSSGVKPVKVEKELFDLIERCISISKLTDGAFDITYASMDRIWKFDGSMKEIPASEIINQSVSKVGYDNIVLDKSNQTVFLKIKGMKIGFGAVGKGYAADKAKKLLMQEGAVAGIINASGDMNTWGSQANGSEWMVGIKNPLNKNKVFATMPVSNKAVVTSGNYEKYVEFGGKRYSHIINPKTGYPSSGIVSASVFAPKAELADALATSVFVMGVDVGIDFIEQLNGVECILVDDSGKIHASKGIELNKY